MFLSQPSDVLIDSDCFIKLCDFGLARSLTGRKNSSQSNNGVVSESGDDTADGPALTEYVATRWYRAPEILLACHNYTKGVDLWSLGCILGEMLSGKALFPGASTLNQIERIMAGLPKPSREGMYLWLKYLNVRKVMLILTHSMGNNNIIKLNTVFLEKLVHRQ